MPSPTRPVAAAPRGRAITGYIWAWVIGGAVCAGLLLLAAPPRAADLGLVGGPLAALVFVVLAALAEGIELRFNHGRAVEVLTLLEAAVAAALVLFAPGWALVITLAGVAVAQFVRGRETIKVAFNLGQFAVATVLAATVTQAARAGADPLSLRGLSAVAAGMLIFGTVNAAAVSGIVARIDGRPFFQQLVDDNRMTLLSVFGNTAVGILAALLWDFRPELLPLLLAPAATLHLAYRGTVRGAALLSQARAERDRLDRVVAAASDGIVLLDEDGRVQVWSPAMAELTGVPASDAMGTPLSAVLVATDTLGTPVDPLEPLRLADRDQPARHHELQLHHQLGGARTVLARHTVLFDRLGNCTGDVVLFHDVTRQREVEALKDDFVARVSHELRTPLTPIKGFAQSLRLKGDQLAPEVRQLALDRIVEQSDHMARLIDDLLLVSQVSAGRSDLAEDLEREPVDIVLHAGKVVESFRTTNAKRVIEFEYPELPAKAFGDPTRVEHVLGNLLSNACKYSPDDAPITARIWQPDPSHVAISVTDQGRGIAPDHLDRIFERFHRVENPLRMETSGIGIGLYISRQFAEAMGGTLTVKSRIGVGSTFTLTLPAADHV